MAIININGTEINYNYIKKEKPTIIFIHGLACDSSYWNSYFKILSKEYSVLAFDLLGHGKSSKPKDKSLYTIENLFKILKELIKILKINEYYLIGHSLGGLIALLDTNCKKKFLISPITSSKDLKQNFLNQVKISSFIPKQIFSLINLKTKEIKNDLLFKSRCLENTPNYVIKNILSNLKEKYEFNLNNSFVINCSDDKILKKSLSGTTIKGKHLESYINYSKFVYLIQKNLNKNSS